MLIRAQMASIHIPTESCWLFFAGTETVKSTHSDSRAKDVESRPPQTCSKAEFL